VVVKNSVVVLALVAATLALVAPSAFAGRPLSTSDAGTVDKGTVEVEIGTEYDSGQVVSKSIAAELAVTYGLIENVEVGACTGGIVYGKDGCDDITGLADSALGAKWRFFSNEDKGLSAAVCAEVVLPTGDVSKGLGGDEYDWAGTLIGSYVYSPEWAFHVNAGYAWVMTEDDVCSYSAAAERVVNDSVTLVAEVVHDQSPYGVKDDKSTHVLVGGTIGVTDSMTIDLGVGAGLDNRTPDVIGKAGLTLAL
jgi:hypothetical protein